MACENAAPRDYRACRTGGQGPCGHPRRVIGVGDPSALPTLDHLRWARARVPVSVACVILGETELEIEVDEPEPKLDPGATRERERERDATIIAPAPRRSSPAAAVPANAASVRAQPFGSFTPASPARGRGDAATRQW